MQDKWCQKLAQRYKSRRPSYEHFGRKYEMSQKQPKLKVILHAFGLSRGPSSERQGIPPMDMVGH